MPNAEQVTPKAEQVALNAAPSTTGIERGLESSEPEDAGDSTEMPGPEPVWGETENSASEADYMNEQGDQFEQLWGRTEMAACTTICQWMVYS